MTLTERCDKKGLTKEILTDLFVNQLASYGSICQQYRVSKETLRRLITDYDLKRNKPSDRIKKPTAEELRTNYINNNMTMKGIAEFYGVAETTMLYWLRSYRISKLEFTPRNTKGKPKAKELNGEYTSELHRIVAESIKPHQLQQKCKVGDTVKVKAMFPAGQGGATFERMTKTGIVSQKTNHFIVVQYEYFKQCHLNVDLRMGVERMEIV